ncbi:small subunit processome component 20 homolog isoform X2 [Rhynchophorus ferrugineus]|uniref:small subunit processome component 20 homolog isoform X2 n=1 Tax=Rhynchophorus ferrugineus TaxID=354439 RepID=UPI003FCDF7EB
MKNKSTKHKETNTFKFQPFSERISNIDVDIFHKVRHEYEQQSEEGECYFYQTIQKWDTLNLTEAYNQFRRELRVQNYITLPQLLLDKDRVIEVLVKHIKLKNPLCLQPLLEIAVALAQDLQKEFYPYYDQFLQILIELLNTKDTEQLEWIFTCLAHMFKLLWRPFIKNINEIFVSLLPLLSDDKPYYISGFAAESFAFVTRKVRDKEAFLDLLIKQVEKRDDGFAGCGRLLFEVIKGVNGQFHSCAEHFLPFFLESLWNNKFSNTILFQINEHIIANIAMYINPQKNSLIWEILLKILSNLEEQHKTGSNINENIEMILKLLGQMVEYRNGKLLQNASPVVQQIVRLISLDKLSEPVLLVLIQISVSVLLSKNIRLPQEQASQIIRNTLALNDKKLLLYFVDNVESCSFFEMLILPSFLRKIGTYKLDTECLNILTKLVLIKSPLCYDGIKLQDWIKYPLDFKDYSEDVAVVFDGILSEEWETNVGGYFSSLVCCPHLVLKSTKKDAIVGRISNHLNILLDSFESSDDNTLVKRLFILNITIETLFHLTGPSVIKEHFNKILSVLSKYLTDLPYIISLKIVSLLVTMLKDDEDIITLDLLKTIDSTCNVNFTSPYHEIRLLTSHIYSAFESLPCFNLRHSNDPDVPQEKWKVFSLCYEVESIESSVQTYREQLQRLEKTIPMRYLCGVLYMNFQLLWEPVVNIIESHAHGLPTDVFWPIFGDELRSVVQNVKKPVTFEVDVLETDFNILQEQYQESQKVSGKPDFLNYRRLLWKSMTSFADVAEARTRDLSELFLNFIEHEYTRKNAELATMCNIKEFSDENSPIDTQEEEDDDAKPRIEPNELGKMGRKTVIRVLLEKLSVFSKFRSPKSAYREPELYQLYFELLKHKNASVQKAALDCVMTYKFKYLVPYKEHLYNLVDEKNFKHTLTSFRVDKETSDIQLEHRDNLIPVILQIVFSKMSTKTGLRTGGKSSGQNRRHLILRFLAGCEEREMIIFVQKAFHAYSRFILDDEEELVDYVAGEVNLEKCLAPKKMLSTVNLVNVILDQFGGLMGNKLLGYLLKILLAIGAMIKSIAANIEQVHSGYFSMLKNVRTSIINSVEQFFERFDQYPWTKAQVNAVFAVFVWPYLDKLNIEGIHSPTALFKLFKTWASHPRFFKLLVKHRQQDADDYILPHVFKLLLNEKSNASVSNAILEMVESMLKFEQGSTDMDLDISNVRPLDEKILKWVQINDKLNYGSCILLPYVPAVLEKIKKKLEGKHKTLNARELFILSRISELVWESDISDTILHLLLPLALKRCTSDEDIVQQLFTTIYNLIRNVNDPKLHLPNIIPLFGEVPHPSSRKILLKVLDRVSEISPDLVGLARLASELNAFDSKWIDQPDFERRHNAFRLIQTEIDADSVDVLLGTLLIHNCFYLMKSEKDLALKDSSSHTLKILCPYLIKKFGNNHKTLENVLTNCVFVLIKKGMRSYHNADLRNECISLLGYLARECPESHFILRDLNRYANKEDLEVDFFENLTHLQIHRHARAMLKFCQVTRDLTECPNSKSLTQFLLPLASHYLCSEKFQGKNAVIDAAIEMMGVICRILPWHQYEGVLKFCLLRLRHKIEFQKQLVRLTVTILDAFHFDLSKGHVDMDLSRKNLPKEEEVVTATEDKTEEADEKIQDDAEADVEVEDVLDEDVDENDDEEGTEDNSQKITEKITILCKSTATRIIKTIQTVLLPQLHRVLAQFTNYETAHKVNRKKTGAEREEEDMARVPISLAVVKLLQRLPKEILDHNLPGVFLKLCSFLKSQLESVRRIARETLQNIMITLGPKYLQLLLREIAPLLNRGFQVHVLVFTVHGVLSCLKGTYEERDIDEILLTVLNLCMADLFGILSEEKEVVKITAKVSEAKATKSYDTLQILAQHITEQCLMDIILPIKQYIESSHSFKTIQKVQEALRFIVMGLVENTFISSESLLKFAYGTSAQKIAELLPRKKKKQEEEDKEKQARKREDCFIIPRIPGNRTQYRELNVKVASNTNSYVLVEFGLRLCLALLKREKIKDVVYRPYIDPFVGIFQSSLKSKHVKLCTVTLQCLQWVMKYELPSMKARIKSIAKEMFAILHKYAASGLSKGDNFDLVVSAFKATAVLVRDVQYHVIDKNQLKILLLYVEQDMHDHDRQATAFNLLKAIIARKLTATEINSVMSKVAELSITSELNHVRTQARTVFHQYLMEYPLQDTLEKHLGFYLSQLSYDLQHGRESAIDMIQTLIHTFPLPVLKNHAGTMLISLGARLVNDDVPECRKLVAACIAMMLSRLSKTDRDPLFDVLILWMKDSDLNHQRLGAQICGIFVTVEKEDFESRLPVVTPRILRLFKLAKKTPGKFVMIPKEKSLSDVMQKIQDHHHYQVMQMVLKICAVCPSFLKQTKDIELLAFHAQSLLAYPHDWVRLSAAQFLGFVLSSTDIDHLADLLVESKSGEGYLCEEPEMYIKNLTLDLCDQLQPGDIKSDLAEQVIKNLVFIARVLQKVPHTSEKKINLLWLAKRMRKIVNSEVIENVSSITLRTEVFKWIAGIVTVLDTDNVKPILHHLVAPLVRELISTDEKNAPIRQLAKEVSKHLKGKIGVELYTQTLQSLQQNLEVKRAERKRSRTQLAVIDPEAYAQKKIKRHEKKKVTKKRKLEELRGKKNFKRRKVVDLEDNSDII